MFNYPYDSNNIRPVVPQTQIQCFAVTSREEANHIPIQIGVMYVIINKSEKEIYVKQYNNDGLIDMDIYKDEKNVQPPKEEKDYTEILNNLTSKVEELQKSIKTPEVTNV